METELGEPPPPGLRFGAAARDYERGRPGWPAELVERAAAALELDPSAPVLEVAAGTGKLTRVLTARFAHVVAVEPSAPLREIAAVTAPGAELLAGTAERLPVPDGSVRGVFVAEAFHWFDAPAALAEAARVLTPGGGLALLWGLPTGSWEPPLPEPARRLVRDAVAAGGDELGKPRLAEEAFASSGFEQPREVASVPHEQRVDAGGLGAYLLSLSAVAGLPAAERERLRAELTGLLPPAEYHRPLRTALYCARLLPVRWCPHCGEPAEAGAAHPACLAALDLEPQRFCRYCRRRMKVQVLPVGWTASCVAHGAVSRR